jgi:hypothetical protein
MRSIEHRCYLVALPMEWLLELDLEQHLGSHHCCRLEYCSDSSAGRWWDVVEDLMGLMVWRFEEHAAPSLVLDYPSYLAADPDVVAFDVDQKDVT